MLFFKVPPADFGSLRGERPCGGTPPSPAGDTSPFRGGRPKSRLRRLAVGLLRSPLEERFTVRLVGPAVLSGRQAAVSYSGVLVRMGPIAGLHSLGQEAQTAAGVRSSRFLPKTARRCNWRAHFGFTGLKACPFAAYLSFCERCLLFFCVGLGGADLWF